MRHVLTVLMQQSKIVAYLSKHHQRYQLTLTKKDFKMAIISYALLVYM